MIKILRNVKRAGNNHSSNGAPGTAESLEGDGRLLMLLCIAVIVAVGVIDHYNGGKPTLHIFYCVPIFVAGLRGSTSSGLVAAAVAGAAWGFAHQTDPRYATAFHFWWTIITRELTLLFLVLCASALRAQGATLIRLLAAEARADETERHLLRILGEQRHRLACEVNGLLLPPVKALEAFIVNTCQCSTDLQTSELSRQLDCLNALIGDVAKGLTLTALPQETFTGLMRRLAYAWSASMGIEITFKGEEPSQHFSQVEMEHFAAIAREAVREAFNNRARSIFMSFAMEDDQWHLTIEDDGDGYQSTPFSPAWSIAHTHADQLKASLTACPVLPRGAMISCRLKVTKTESPMDEAALTPACIA